MTGEGGIGRRRSAWPLAALAAVFLGPLAGAWLLFGYTDSWRPPSSHHGVLVEPLLTPSDYAAALPPGVAADALRDHWTLLVLAPRPHNDDGARLLHDLRQLHVALGKHSDRVRRLVITDGGTGAPVAAPARDPYLQVVRTSPRALARLRERLPGTGASGRRLYLVDPLGNLMMRYPLPTEPRGVLDDLRRLMRTSRIG